MGLFIPVDDTECFVTAGGGEEAMSAKVSSMMRSITLLRIEYNGSLFVR